MFGLKIKIKDEVTFSFEAAKDKPFENYQVVEVALNVRILRLVLYMEQMILKKVTY
jgi:hypothetical protein